MEWKSAMQHSGASGRQAIFGPVRAAGSARCALGVAWRGERLVGTTQRRGIDSRRELLDAQGGCGLRGECFLVLSGATAWRSPFEFVLGRASVARLAAIEEVMRFPFFSERNGSGYESNGFRKFN